MTFLIKLKKIYLHIPYTNGLNDSKTVESNLKKVVARRHRIRNVNILNIGEVQGLCPHDFIWSFEQT